MFNENYKEEKEVSELESSYRSKKRFEFAQYLMEFVKHCCMEKDVSPEDMALLPEIAKLLWRYIAP